MSKLTPYKPHHHAIVAQRARDFRHHLTVEEAALWRALRGGQLGVRFVRQRVVGPFIADFAAPAVRLIVEVDGGYHAQREAADARRDRQLARWGWSVLRVDARTVMRALPEVVGHVQRAIDAARVRRL